MPENHESWNSLFISRLLKNNMVAGLLIIIPILVTLWVGWWSISVTTDWAVHLLQKYKPELADRTSIVILFRLITLVVLAVVIAITLIIALFNFALEMILGGSKASFGTSLLDLIVSLFK